MIAADGEASPSSRPNTVKLGTSRSPTLADTEMDGLTSMSPSPPKLFTAAGRSGAHPATHVVPGNQTQVARLGVALVAAVQANDISPRGRGPRGVPPLHTTARGGRCTVLPRVDLAAVGVDAGVDTGAPRAEARSRVEEDRLGGREPQAIEATPPLAAFTPSRCWANGVEAWPAASGTPSAIVAIALTFSSRSPPRRVHGLPTSPRPEATRVEQIRSTESYEPANSWRTLAVTRRLETHAPPEATSENDRSDAMMNRTLPHAHSLRVGTFALAAQRARGVRPPTDAPLDINGRFAATTNAGREAGWHVDRPCTRRHAIWPTRRERQGVPRRGKAPDPLPRHQRKPPFRLTGTGAKIEIT